MTNRRRSNTKDKRVRRRGETNPKKYVAGSFFQRIPWSSFNPFFRSCWIRFDQSKESQYRSNCNYRKEWDNYASKRSMKKKKVSHSSTVSSPFVPPFEPPFVVGRYPSSILTNRILYRNLHSFGKKLRYPDHTNDPVPKIRSIGG